MNKQSERFGKTIDRLIINTVKSTITSMDTMGYDLVNNEKNKISLRTGYIKNHLDSINNVAVEVANDLGLEYTPFDKFKALKQLSEIYTNEKNKRGLVSVKLQRGDYDFNLGDIR